MDLWLLTAKLEYGYWENMNGIVVRAKDADHAREIANDHGQEEMVEYPDYWLDPEKSDCRMLYPNPRHGGGGKDGMVILRSVNWKYRCVVRWTSLIH